MPNGPRSGTEQGRLRVAVLPLDRATLEFEKKQEWNALVGAVEFPLGPAPSDANIGLNGMLTGASASVLAGAIKGLEPLKTQYCFVTSGRSPVYKGEVEVHWATTLQMLKMQFKSGQVFWRKEVHTEIQKLIRAGSLGVRILTTGDSEANGEEFLRKGADVVVERLFKAEVPADGGSQMGGSFGTRILLDHTRNEVNEGVKIHFDRSEPLKQGMCIPFSMDGISSHPEAYLISAYGVVI